MVFSLLWDLYQEWKKPKIVKEVVFLHNKLLTKCKKHQFSAENQKNVDICTNVDCYYYNLDRMVSYLDKAEKTIDLCMYLLSMPPFTDRILKAHKRGVIVRVITDHSQAFSAGSKTIDLLNAGIAVRTRPSPMLMHHKFCIIDRNETTAVVLSGSLNWTKSTFGNGNMDNAIICNDPNIIGPFSIEFDKLWHEFSEHNEFSDGV